MNEEMEKIAEYERGQKVRSVKPLSLTLRLKDILTWGYTVFEHFHLFFKNDGEKNPTRNFLDDPRRSGPIPEADRKEGSRRHVRNWGGLDFENVKTGAEAGKEWTVRNSLYSQYQVVNFGGWNFSVLQGINHCGQLL